MVLTVWGSDETTMLERLFARNGLDEYHARMMIRSQMPLDEKCRRATIVIRNEKTVGDLYNAVDAVLAQRKPSRLIHTVGLWLVPITTSIALTSLAMYKLYAALSAPSK
jgi:hypothetical protein